MGDEEFSGSSGSDNPYTIDRETRVIALALGIQATVAQVFDPLTSMLGDDFEVGDDGIGRYASDAQGVDFEIRPLFTKSEYKEAIQTPDLHVVYMGHARYGRGACFARDGSEAPGDSWEMGTPDPSDPDNPYSDEVDGIFRLAYPYVPVEIDDIEHHRYHFAPIPAEWEQPPNGERHPDARRGLTAITLAEEFRELVLPDYASEAHRYWGYSSGKTNLLFHAGWSETLSSPMDMGATDIRCRCFCHFGCSSRLHFREIIRGGSYKDWQRDDPNPTENFAYFTTATSNLYGTLYWLYYVLSYDQPSAGQSWWGSLSFARNRANARLTRERRNYQLY